MIKSETDLKMADGQSIHIYLWQPDQDIRVKAIVQIAHGAGEYGRRYEDFARYLTDDGFIVCASDHRGHGLSLRDQADRGFFSDQDGWQKVTDDLHAVTLWLKERYKDMGVFLLGHSMGSFLARTYAILYGRELRGLILSGTAHNPKPLLLFAKGVAALDIRAGRARKLNPLLNKMAFKDLNKSFKSGKTAYEWLSRDPEIVAAYINDELCGFDFTSSAFRDMFGGLLLITDKQNIKRTPPELPILLVAGQDDPVGAKGKLVAQCYRQYRKAGSQDIGMKLYPGMRHEILNEIGKEEVYQDIRNWLNGLL